MTDQTADPDANHIATTSITIDAASDHLEADIDDDQRWIETVIASLNGRSREAQQALMVALFDGQPAQAKSVMEDRSNAVMDDRDQPRTTSCVAFPSPAPARCGNHLRSARCHLIKRRFGNLPRPSFQ